MHVPGPRKGLSFLGINEMRPLYRKLECGMNRPPSGGILPSSTNLKTLVHTTISKGESLEPVNHPPVLRSRSWKLSTIEGGYLPRAAVAPAIHVCDFL